MNHDEWFDRPFLLLSLVFLILFYIFLSYSAIQFYNLGITPQGASLTAQAASHSTVNATEFFLNNLKISISLFIPIVGMLYFFTAVIASGHVLGLLAASCGVNPLIYVLGVSIPVGIVEFAAYSVLAAEITWLTILTFSQTGAKQRLVQQTWKTIILYFVLLVVSAVLEAIL